MHELNLYKNDSSAKAMGARLRYVRKLAHLKRKDLAQRASVGETTISYWEHATFGSSKMTNRSMEKILKAVREAGVECSDRWLREGSGAPPQLMTRKPSIPNLMGLSEEHDLITRLISNLNEEVKLFASLSSAIVVSKVDIPYMLPAFEEGDIVGGLWQSSANLKTERMCIVHINDELQIRRVKPGSQPGLFSLSYLNYAPNQIEPFEIKDVPLEKVAPIIRVWRPRV